ncbi:MAG: DUF721 domain-containing protein [Alphaproteobacteria bacterium]
MAKGSKGHGPLPIARLASRVINTATAKRGFAKADLISAWAEVAGPRYAALTQPESLRWPRDQAFGAILTVRVDGPAAVFLQHEADQFISRVNAFLGYAAVSELRIVQKPLGKKPATPGPPIELPPAMEKSIRRAVSDVESDGLRSALEQLGRAVATDRLARP